MHIKTYAHPKLTEEENEYKYVSIFNEEDTL